MNTTVLSSKSVQERIKLAEDSDLDEETQHALAADTNPRVRELLAENDDLAARIQLVLAGDEEEGVRRALAAHRALAPEVQLALAADSRLRVKWRLARNPRLVLTDAFPVAFLDLGSVGQEYATQKLVRSGLDLKELSILRKGWTGTLSELIETAQELSATPA